MNITTEQLFDHARTHNGFTAEPIPQATLHQLYDLMKWGPTSANCSPARIVFVSSPEGKEKLLAGMSPGNVEKTRSAPVTAIIGMDMAFYDNLPQLFPHADAKPWFVGKQPMIDATAFRNSSLQGGYFIIAAACGTGTASASNGVASEPKPAPKPLLAKPMSSTAGMAAA